MRQERNKSTEGRETQLVRLTVKNTVTGENTIVLGTIHGKPIVDAAAGKIKKYKIDILSEYLKNGIPESVVLRANEFERLRNQNSGFLG